MAPSSIGALISIGGAVVDHRVERFEGNCPGGPNFVIKWEKVIETAPSFLRLTIETDNNQTKIVEFLSPILDDTDLDAAFPSTLTERATIEISAAGITVTPNAAVGGINVR